MKRTALLRRTPLRSRPKRVDLTDPARVAWKTSQSGWCQCGCDRFSLHLEKHHVTERQTVVREGRPDLEWDPRNGMYLAPICHARHTSAMRRIPLPSVPDAAVAFAVELFGSDLRAAQYLARFYQAELPEGSGGWQP